VREQLDVFEQAVADAPRQPLETFVTAPTPGIISTSMQRSPDHATYSDDRQYLFAVASELGKEYRHVVDRGHVLQLDAPDLAMERHFMFADRPEVDFLERMELHIEALNVALDGVARDQVRLHVCWGNYDGPHTNDVELETILTRLYEAGVGALMLPFGNPRHQHDTKQLRVHALPDDMLVVAGVIDTTTNYVEHPEVVANRLVAVAEAVGDPTRVIAGTDCGLSTFAGFSMVAEDVAWAKLRSLTEGAHIASERLL
jgi:5-methyltetrahydropteroyltriglutamate--homocysteine methyltransferase